MTVTAAQRLVDLAAAALGGPLPIRIRAWDGSVAGPSTGPTLVIANRRALRRMLYAPGELGLGEAYVSGDLDVEGDLAEGLALVWSAYRAGGLRRPRVGDYPRLIAGAARLGILGPRPPAPGTTARLGGRQHDRDRDRAAIAHHYDLSNDFYELLLDETMAYSCAYFAEQPSGPPDRCALATAQRAKLDLVCRKLGLAAGKRHLDIGCGWGSLVCHAAEHYGTESTGVTLSRAQYEFVSKRVADAGLGDRVTVRHADYRELQGSLADLEAYDAVSTIEMGEHVGEAEYPAFAQILHDVLHPGGRALVQQMSRGRAAAGGGAFIETYIAPDMHMKPVATTVGLLAGAGLEIRDLHAMREHYVWTSWAWQRTLEERWDAAVATLGDVGARVWRLYLAGGGLAFAENRMGVDQILAVRPDTTGRSGLGATRDGWEG